MKKITKLLLFTFALMFALPTFAQWSKPFKHTFNSTKGWDIRNGISYRIEDETLVLEKGEGLFFKRIQVDPGRKYEIRLTGSGNGTVYNGYADVIASNPFKDSNSYSRKFKLPQTTPERMMLRLLPKKGEEFRLKTIELIPLPEPTDWVRLNRKILNQTRPTPKIIRGMSCHPLDNDKAKLMKEAYAQAVIVKFKDVSELDDLNKRVDIALQNGLKPIVAYDSDKNLEETWLATKASLGDRVGKIYAFMLSNANVSRDDFNALVKKLRSEFKNSWFIFHTKVNNYPDLNPIDDYKIIYSANFTNAVDLEKAKIFINMYPVPFIATGSAKMADVFEAANISWIIGSMPKNLKRNIAKIERPMHKGGTAQEQLQSLIKTFNKNRKTGTLEFAYATDTHYHSSKKPTPASLAPKHMRDMAKVAKELKLDFVANGGDMVNGARPREENISDMNDVIQAMATSGLPVFATMGNHDDGVFWCLRKFKKSDISLITTGEDWHNTCVKDVALGRGAIGDKNFEKANYCYMDFPESKIRFINMCISENPMTIGKNGRFVIDSCALYDISGRQIDWLATQALNFSDKENPSEWAVILMSHEHISEGMPNGKLVMGVLRAFINGSKFSGKSKKGHFPTSISCDFTKQGKLQVLMNIAGHHHNDACSYSSLGYLYVRTLNDVMRAKHIDRAVGEPTEWSWSLVTVDREKGEATLLRYGAGVDMKAPLFNPKLKKAKDKN